VTLTQRQIVSEIVKFSMNGMGIGKAPDIEKIKSLSLQDMLDAVRQVERDNADSPTIDGTRSFSLVPDDRLVAAVYTWLHYVAPGLHDVGSPDDSIVHLIIGGNIHGLVKYARPAPQDDDEED
jgi:hypothetical protein